MNRFIAFTAFAALIAGCSDAPVAPRSLQGTGPLFAEDPPPPPVTGDNGFGFFSANVSESFVAASAEPCVGEFAVTSTFFEFVYTTDNSSPDGHHEVAHIKFDESLPGQEDLSHQIVIRQDNDLLPTIDANGLIVGPTFSFRIMSNKPVAGDLNPGGFLIEVTGILKTADGSRCETMGRFFGVFPSPPPLG